MPEAGAGAAVIDLSGASGVPEDIAGAIVGAMLKARERGDIKDALTDWNMRSWSPAYLP